MIVGAFQHCPGVGPVRAAELCEAGVRTWRDAIDKPERIPASLRSAVVKESQRCLTALDERDVQYFVDKFAAADKWRILSHFLEEATFFDIETSGLEADSVITVIGCWRAGEFKSFVEHENLDEFLALLDEVKLLVSFNGSTFDVPRVLDAFHIPTLPCPHLDLRWPCYHRGFSGGLKEIASRMGIERPADLQDVNGQQAILLWQAWQKHEDRAAREHLIRYCAADVLLTVMIARQLVDQIEAAPEGLWSTLPAAEGVCESLLQVRAEALAAPAKSRATNRKRALLAKRWAG